jgi:N-acetylneuraminic acid mutarotase
VVKGVWYVMGGSADGSTYSDATWAYNLKTRTWSAKSPMPVALNDAGVAVFDDVIYVIGGNSDSMSRANTVERYNPATDTWTEEVPPAHRQV